MMKRIILSTMALTVMMSVTAQDAYDAAILATEDLNGTARYVGMGGALDALGADISTISSNPAALGLFRHSDLRLSLSVLSQSDARKYGGVNPTTISFDQVGFVWSNPTSQTSYLNLGFNYHRSRNFNQIIAASNAFAPSKSYFDDKGNLTGIVGSGQNLQTLVKGYRGLFNSDKADADGINYYDSQVDNSYSQLLRFEDPKTKDVSYYPLTASSFNFDKGTKGFIGVYEFNVSGNSNDRVYWGVTLGIHDIHYESHTTYSEALEAGQSLPNDVKPTSAGLIDERTIKGMGFNLKAGVIVRPVAESPFRLGLAISSPTWYKLKTNNNTTVYVDEQNNIGESYEFKYYTPWTIGLSLGHTVGNFLALGFGYEYTIFNTADMRYYTYYGNGGDASRSDKDMDEEIGLCLRGTHALKAGIECRPIPELALRLGYNFVSSPYRSDEDAYRNQKVYSPGVYYASTTDYINWNPTHRITAGLGTKLGKFGIDLAYQCALTSGRMYPFVDGEYYEDDVNKVENHAPMTKVNFRRHQFLLTLGYSF